MKGSLPLQEADFYTEGAQMTRELAGFRRAVVERAGFRLFLQKLRWHCEQAPHAISFPADLTL